MKSNDFGRSWLEISDKALRHNLNYFRKLAGNKTYVLSVVKANAYGHGISQASKILDKGGSDWFGVDSLGEALCLREIGVRKPVLVLGFIPKDKLKIAIGNNISFIVYSQGMLSSINRLRLKKRARVHLKIETGLNRQGLHLNELLSLTEYIKKQQSRIALEGLSTHFANVEDTLDSSFALKQLASFEKSTRLIQNIYPERIAKHCAASAAAMLYPNTHFDLIRVGIGLYGLWPSKETQVALSLKSTKNSPKLKTVLSWKCPIAQIKILKMGSSVGYGQTWYSPRKSIIAIIPVGYSDGYDRRLSSNSEVIIKSKKAPVVGRVAMNMTAIDVTHIPNVSTSDTVILIGKSRGVEVSADNLALRLGTINYEIVSRINSNLPRIVV